jgi:hypothetical protein
MILAKMPTGSARSGRSENPGDGNMLLAARALGLGTALMALNLAFEKDAGAALGLPPDWHSYAILPIGYPMIGSGRLAGSTSKMSCWRADGGSPTAIDRPTKSAGTTMTGFLLALCGVALAIMAVWQLFATFRSGTFRARGGRHIRRARHPVMCWANVAGLVAAAVVGVVLVLWAW